MSADRAHEPSRAEARRAQIRTAAAECFRQRGFHGTSIAEISQAAGMSTGHIYHYFENKEAIIADIVAQDMERTLAVTQALRAAPDPKAAIVERAARGVQEVLDPSTAALQIEIVAEAARNPHIAGIVRSADAVWREHVLETLRAVRQAGGDRDDDATLRGMVETIGAMFEGLRVRAIRNPDIDREAVMRLFRRIVDDLITRSA
ncbi:MAG TPA: TetR/AcrR family transcriptional regulator [Burkholderiales bacterium]